MSMTGMFVAILSFVGSLWMPTLLGEARTNRLSRKISGRRRARTFCLT
jgi:hypothetical protein